MKQIVFKFSNGVTEQNARCFFCDILFRKLKKMEPVTRTVGKDVMTLRLLDHMIIAYTVMTQLVQIVNAAVGGVIRK